MGRLPGQLWFHFTVAILLTALVSSIVLAWYRRAVRLGMGIACDVAEQANSRLEGQSAAQPRATVGRQIAAAGETAVAEDPLRRRVAVVYGLGGLAAGAVMATLYLVALGDPLRPTRTLALLLTFCWPIVPTLSVLLVFSRKRTLLVFSAYVAVGALLIASLSATLRYALGWADAEPLKNAVAFLQFLTIEAWPPFLIILVTSGRRIRSVAPLVLAGLLVFSFSNFAVGYGLILAMDNVTTRNALLSTGAFVGYNASYMLAALPIGYACWLSLRWLGRRYEEKAFSDVQLLVDAWWLIVAFTFSMFLTTDFGWGGLLGLTAFVAYRAVVAAGLALWPHNGTRLGNHRLLLLRVFGFPRRTERLFDFVAQRWRWIGSVRMIAGPDLATRTIGPGDLIAFAGGRLRQLFLQRDWESFHQLDSLDEARDPDGRHRVNKVYCYKDIWQPALQRLLATTDIVLMDLRGFSPSKEGCLFELRQLAGNGLLGRTIFVVDDTTDAALLQATMSETVFPGEAPLRLVFARSGSTTEINKVLDALRTLVRECQTPGAACLPVSG